MDSLTFDLLSRTKTYAASVWWQFENCQILRFGQRGALFPISVTCTYDYVHTHVTCTGSTCALLTFTVHAIKTVTFPFHRMEYILHCLSFHLHFACTSNQLTCWACLTDVSTSSLACRLEWFNQYSNTTIVLYCKLCWDTVLLPLFNTDCVLWSPLNCKQILL